MKVIVGISGASGIEYGIELLKALKKAGAETFLVMSEWAEKIVEIETGYKISEVKGFADHVYGSNDMSAPIASSSFLVDAMVVIPASIKTVSEITTAHTGTLLTRCADIMLKMRRRLIVCPRETPLSTPALDTMHRLSLAGAVILPLSPGFYHKPKDIKDLYKFITSKVLDVLGIDNSEIRRWGD